jgi:UDP-N-acetylmuramate--alanine ligase
MWEKDYKKLNLLASENITIFTHQPTADEIGLTGQFMRENAFLVQQVLAGITGANAQKLDKILGEFPGAGRRFEKLADSIYSDYAHHPTEIKATIEKALEINPEVVVVYQPHQNIRQHEVQDLYGDTFAGIKKLYWLPTYLTRENDLPVLTPNDLIKKIDNPEIAEPAEFNDELFAQILGSQKSDALVLVLGAGPIDNWVREKLSS